MVEAQVARTVSRGGRYGQRQAQEGCHGKTWALNADSNGFCFALFVHFNSVDKFGHWAFKELFPAGNIIPVGKYEARFPVVGACWA